MAAAGRPWDKIGPEILVDWDELHPGGWDAAARLAEQDRDGVHVEVLYPSVGMIICNPPDTDYKTACFDAYNQWLAEFVAVGTAVKHKGGGNFRNHKNEPFSSDLSGQEFWTLLRAGYRPVGFVMGSCVYYVPPNILAAFSGDSRPPPFFSPPPIAPIFLPVSDGCPLVMRPSSM